MIEILKSKSKKFNQESSTKEFKQEDSLIPNIFKKQNRFNLRKEALRRDPTKNPLLIRDKQVIKYKMMLNRPR
jgi:hypothetical protein